MRGLRKASNRPTIAAWASQLGPPAPESARSRALAHAGGLVSIVAVIGYLTWRIGNTLPHGTLNRSAAWVLISFEVFALVSLTSKTWALWNIDAPAPAPLTAGPPGLRLVLLIPTYNEPRDIIAPTVAAACALQPAHQTWVLDDGDRLWVKEMAAVMGARYVSRAVHDHAKAGNLNHALGILAQEQAAGIGGADIVAVLDCDHVPLPAFFLATLGWFADPRIALVQGPQATYNHGAFDDDGFTGEQGLFFNVLMPARHAAGIGPFWCGSTSLLRFDALLGVGGVSTETVTEDLHTTLKLLRAGWRTAYHHQTLAVGLAPSTPDQYLTQRRRWGLGTMQVLQYERLWVKRWLSWRNYYEYFTSSLWWLEGLALLGAFAIPVLTLVSGAQTSTARPLTYVGVFTAMFLIRLFGAKLLLRGQVRWRTSFALRVIRIPIGLSCAWWLVTRRVLEFEVTPKGGGLDRDRGRAPRLLWGLITGLASVGAYAVAGLLHLVPWRTSPASTAASGVWLVVATGALVYGLRRIQAPQFATSRRDAPRVPFAAVVHIDDVAGRLIDISVGGAAVRLPAGAPTPAGLVVFEVPGGSPIKMEVVSALRTDTTVVSLRVHDDDWESRRMLALWIFHTPPGAVPELPPGVPVAAVTAIGTTPETSAYVPPVRTGHRSASRAWTVAPVAGFSAQGRHRSPPAYPHRPRSQRILASHQQRARHYVHLSSPTNRRIPDAPRRLAGPRRRPDRTGRRVAVERHRGGGVGNP